MERGNTSVIQASGPPHQVDRVNTDEGNDAAKPVTMLLPLGSVAQTVGLLRGGKTYFPDSAVSDLLGGLKRRLTLARAFLTRPRVVVLDEPTTGLDPQSRNRAWDQLTRMKSAGSTILMSTHYMEEASMLCDRLVIMDNGRILAQGTPDELIERYAGSETAAVRPFPGHRTDVEQQLEQSGFATQNRGAVVVVSGVDGRQRELSEISHASVMFRPSNLEDVFLNLTGRELREE